MDAEAWNRVVAVLRKGAEVVLEKDEFVAGSKALGETSANASLCRFQVLFPASGAIDSELQLVKGKWVPEIVPLFPIAKDLFLKQIRDSTESFVKTSKPGFLRELDRFDALLDILRAAKTQDAFDGILEEPLPPTKSE